MATLILSAAGSAIGGAFGGGFLGLSGAVIGKAVGAAIGSSIDQRLLGAGSSTVEAGRVETLRIQSSAEGAPVARVFGKMRVGGQVIWASRFRETKSQSGGGKNAPKVINYSYSVSLAVALCEGEVLRVGRIWADGNEIALDDINWRLHRGTQDQMPDALMEAIEGGGEVPAYRGIAYVVFEDLPLGPFGNRVPQFNIEVIRRVHERGEDAPIDPFAQIKSIALMPGTGEYSLATRKVHLDRGLGSNTLVNVNNASGGVDFDVSMEHLAIEMPQVESVGLVVSWFGDDLRCGHCSIRPKVEQNQVDGSEMPWEVSSVTRQSADLTSQVDGRPNFGGTPADRSVIEAIQRIHENGQKVMFYPFILMDIPAGNILPDPWTGGTGQAVFPWRGRITLDLAPGLAGTTDKTPQVANDVSSFFGLAQISDFSINGDAVSYSGPSEFSLRRFILHYAHLCVAAGGVDTFCISSEMRSLTQLRDGTDSFPAVAALVALAADVRAIVGPGTKITYAADWSEYFGYHPNDGSGDIFFHLDALWASDDIDAIGIDNYMPLSDWRDGSQHLDADHGSIYDLDYLAGNVAGGEGYDWYYLNQDDRDAQIRVPIEDTAEGEDWLFRYKDIKSWWSETHYNRLGGVKASQPTDWVPTSKPVWFTELGCAAIDKGTNQPNVFLDEKSSESSLPYYSSGARDDYMQYRYLQAHWTHWSDLQNNPVSPIYGGLMVDMDRAHIWAWDARPWPDFPERLNVWSDGENYARGHWITGRIGNASLSAIVGEVAERSEFLDYDVSALHGSVEGYILQDAQSARQALQPLMLTHAFDATERDGKVVFENRSSRAAATVTMETLVVERDTAPLRTERAVASEAPTFVQVNYYRAEENYLIGAATAGVPLESDVGLTKADIPVALSAGDAGVVATRWLTEVQVAQDSAEVMLPPSQLSLTAGDVVELPTGADSSRYRIDEIEDRGYRRANCVRIEDGVYKRGPVVERVAARPNFAFPTAAQVTFLDLPIIRGDETGTSPLVAVQSVPWRGRHSVYAGLNDNAYALNSEVYESATMGIALDPLPRQIPGLWGYGAPLRVLLGAGELISQTREDVENGANLAAIRAPGGADWEIFQFETSDLIGPNEYRINGFLRGQFGTDAIMPDLYPVGSEIVLLDGALETIDLPPNLVGVNRHYRIGPSSRPYDDDSYVHSELAFYGIGLRPHSPAHLRFGYTAEGDAQINWIRRTRIGGDNWQGPDVPLAEAEESYTVKIIKDEIVRGEHVVGVQSFVYTNAMQTADGVSVPFDVSVAQNSMQYGAGPASRITVYG
jgi:hypothetical protein